MRKMAISYLIVSVMIISTLLCIKLTDEVAALDAEDEVRLYLANSGLIETRLPSAVGGSSLVPSQDEVMYDTSYPLTRDIEIEGNRSGTGQVLILHLGNSIGTLITQEQTLDIRVLEIASGGGETQIAAGRFEGSDMLEDYLELDLTSGTGTTIKAGSTIQLRIKLEGASLGVSFSFSHNTIPESTYSYLSFRAEPVLEEDLGLKIMDSNGAELEELLPNGPDEARTFDLSISAIDAFGAYDIREINILLTSESENVIWNQTGTPAERGGEMIAHLNETFTIPEGTPEGNYLLKATVFSNTGQTAMITDYVKVASGLQVTVQDPEREADAGEILEFSVSILNGGEGTDRVTFTHSSKLGWTVEDPDPVEIDGGKTETVLFRIQVPIRSTLGDEDTIDLNMESRNAGKTYSRETRVTVVSVAEFGVEIIGDSTGAVVSGGGAQFSIEVINIEDSPSTFETGIENLPAGWSVSYSGSNGSSQGSLFLMDLEGDSEGTVNLNIMTTSSSEGTYPLSAYVRKQGESEKRYVYLKVRVVDPDRSVLTLTDPSDTKQSARSGSNLPVEYSSVYFTLELYNPSLQDSRIRINVYAPTGWDAEYDYANLDLLPGEASSWNISITPRDGELYSEDPFETKVEVDGGTLGTSSRVLKVELKKITSMGISSDRSSMDIREGEEDVVNVTLTNNGNHDVDLIVTLDYPDTLLVTSETTDISIQVNDEEEVKFTVKVLDAGEGDAITFTVGYDSDGIKGTRDITVYPAKKESGGGVEMNLPLIIGIVAGVLILAGVGYFLYTRRSSPGKTARPPAPGKKPSSMEGVKITAVPERKIETGKPVKPSRSRAVEEADDLAASLLGDDGGRKDLSGGVTVEAADDPEVITAEIVE